MSYSKLPSDVRIAAESILTRKQLDVLKLKANGYSYVRISQMLDISEPTVRGHFRRALQLLSIHLSKEIA